MSYRKIICLSAVAALGLAVIASDAEAARGGARGAAGVRAGGGAYRGAAVGVRGGAYRGGAVAYRGGAYRGGAVAYRGGYYGRPGWGAAAVGAGVVGAAAASSYYNYGQRCGYYPYPACY